MIFINWSEKKVRAAKRHNCSKNGYRKLFNGSNVSSLPTTYKRERHGFPNCSQCWSKALGIIYLSERSSQSPRMLFEAGAIAKKFKQSKICLFLIGLLFSNVSYPLASFQCKSTTRSDVRDLLGMINAARGNDALSAIELDEAFDIAGLSSRPK